MGVEKSAVSWNDPPQPLLFVVGFNAFLAVFGEGVVLDKRNLNGGWLEWVYWRPGALGEFWKGCRQGCLRRCTGNEFFFRWPFLWCVRFGYEHDVGSQMRKRKKACEAILHYLWTVYILTLFWLHSVFYFSIKNSKLKFNFHFIAFIFQFM